MSLTPEMPGQRPLDTKAPPQEQDTIIQVRDVVFHRGHKVIFDGLSLDIERGKVTAIMGPSGTGKTTLLRLIGGQLSPESGKILLEGQEVATMTRKQLFAARSRMGMLFQSGALFTDLTVYENVAFPIRAHTRFTEAQIRERVSAKLFAVGLSGTEQLMPSELSGGMSRRVALARAIALDPELVMYDEPFAGQDPIVMGVLARLIQNLSTSLGLTTIIVSHDVHETLAIADYIYVVDQGKVMGEGTPEQIRHMKHGFVYQFMNGLETSPETIAPAQSPQYRSSV